MARPRRTRPNPRNASGPIQPDPLHTQSICASLALSISIAKGLRELIAQHRALYGPPAMPRRDRHHRHHYAALAESRATLVSLYKPFGRHLAAVRRAARIMEPVDGQPRARP